MTTESTMEVWKEFGENEITHSAAHHLLAIMELSSKRGYARVTDVAKFLEITTGSASTNLKSLKQKLYVEEDENKFLKLTARGFDIAQTILKRREILERFFREVLQVDPEIAEIDACKTEHLLSLETTRKMEEFANIHSASTKGGKKSAR